MQNAEALELTALETELRWALGWEPAETAADRMDQAVADAVAGSRLMVHHRARWPLPKLALAVIGTLLLLGAASAVTLLQQAASQMPGWRVAYENAERLDLSETIGDYTVTVARGYVDPNQLVIAYQVDGPAGPTMAVAHSEVVDAQGRSYLNIAGGDVGAKLENSAATITSYQVPPAAGDTVQLTAIVPELVPVSVDNPPAPQGPWVFHFTLPLHPATVVKPMATVTAAGVPITLEQVKITETADRILLSLDLGAVRDQQWTRWQMEGTLQQAHGPVQDLMWAPLPPEWTGQPKSEIEDLITRSEFGDVEVRQTFAGTSSPSGPWTLTVTRLNGFDGSGEPRAVDGPWVFRFTVP